MTELVEALQAALAGGHLAALPLALLGGAVTGLNPCCLPLYPAAAATCCATRGDWSQGGRSPLVFRTAVAFMAGMALSTATLGVVAALAGGVMTSLGGWVRYVVALVPLAMGVHLLGLFRFPLPDLQARLPKGTASGTAAAFMTGLLFALVLAPCGTPILASVLSYAAYEGSVSYGGVLLFVFGLGVGIPILLIGTAASGLASRLDRAGWRSWVNQATGLVLLGVSFYLLWTA